LAVGNANADADRPANQFARESLSVTKKMDVFATDDPLRDRAPAPAWLAAVRPLEVAFLHRVLAAGPAARLLQQACRLSRFPLAG
jgi:hypothetical protein